MNHNPTFRLTAPWLGQREDGTIILGERKTITGAQAVEMTRQHIANLCDGPITTTVLIHRSMELIESEDANAAAAGEALELELEAHNMIRAGNIVVPGS